MKSNLFNAGDFFLKKAVKLLDEYMELDKEDDKAKREKIDDFFIRFQKFFSNTTKKLSR